MNQDLVLQLSWRLLSSGQAKAAKHNVDCLDSAPAVLLIAGNIEVTNKRHMQTAWLSWMDTQSGIYRGIGSHNMTKAHTWPRKKKFGTMV